MPKKVLMACVLAAALPPASAWAEKGQWSLSLSPGLSIPSGPAGSFDDQYGNSLHLLTSVDYELEDGYWYGAELGYSGGHRYKGRLENQNLDGDGSPDAVSFSSDVDATMLSLAPVLKAGGWFMDEVRYVFSVGGGLYTFFRGPGSMILSGTTSNGTVVTGRTMAVARSVNSYGGLSLGHTLAYGITGAFELGLDIRYHLVFMPGGPAGLVSPGLRFAYVF